MLFAKNNLAQLLKDTDLFLVMCLFSLRRKDQFDKSFKALQAWWINHFINLVQLKSLCLERVDWWRCILGFKESAFRAEELFWLVVYLTCKGFFFGRRQICWTQTWSIWFLDVENLIWNIRYEQFLCNLLVYNLFWINGNVLLLLHYLNWFLSHGYLICRNNVAHSNFCNRFSNDIWLGYWCRIFWNWSPYLNSLCHCWLDDCLIYHGQSLWCHVVLVSKSRILLEKWLLSTCLGDRSRLDWSPEAVPERSNCVLNRCL